MGDELNWGGNVRYRAVRIEEPTSLDAARRIVAEARHVRPLGTRHSFNELPDGPEVLLQLGSQPFDPVMDLEAMTVTVAAGTRFGVVAQFLEANGHALHNMGSLPHISVAGAVATGTHGSGDRNRNLSAAVSGLQFITADGDIASVDRTDPRFDGMVVALGALGPVTRVTLDIQPSYQIQQDAYADLPWDTALDHFDDITGAGYSVSQVGPSGDRSGVGQDPAGRGRATYRPGRLRRPTRTRRSARPFAKHDRVRQSGAVVAATAALSARWHSQHGRRDPGGMDGAPADHSPGRDRVARTQPPDRPDSGRDRDSHHGRRRPMALTGPRPRDGRRALHPVPRPGRGDQPAARHRADLSGDRRASALGQAVSRHRAKDLSSRYPKIGEWRALRDQLDPDGKFSNRFLMERVGL